MTPPPLPSEFSHNLTLIFFLPLPRLSWVNSLMYVGRGFSWIAVLAWVVGEVPGEKQHEREEATLFPFPYIHGRGTGVSPGSCLWAIINVRRLWHKTQFSAANFISRKPWNWRVCPLLNIIIETSSPISQQHLGNWTLETREEQCKVLVWFSRLVPWMVLYSWVKVYFSRFFKREFAPLLLCKSCLNSLSWKPVETSCAAKRTI